MHPLFPARRSSDLTNCYAYSLQEQHQFVPLIIGACDVMAATEIQPFDLAKKRTDERFHCCPGPVERQKILLAKRVEMQARNASRSEARSWLIGWPRRLCDWQGSYFSTSPSRCSGLMRRPMSNAFPIRRAASICGRKRAICAGLLKITWSDAFIIAGRSSALYPAQ